MIKSVTDSKIEMSKKTLKMFSIICDFEKDEKRQELLTAINELLKLDIEYLTKKGNRERQTQIKNHN